MACVLCGCSKRSRRSADRSSAYAPSSSDRDELSLRPPSATVDHTHTAPASRSRQHVETYWAAGGTAITVAVRQHHRHHHRHHHHQQQQKQRDEANDVSRQLSEYDTVLDHYQHVAIATQDASVKKQSGKVLVVLKSRHSNAH